ncbi:uncharacterized protein KY384_000712 [Bacidia gigantensis]|uniref:uncharacterized protein n=1 Tax=Bacidia gigantensis TaxID=2732470 RepID=UPI001D03DD31|nr:uncharacterized protein KY384_000712 [Bacidia gigantensis]KAG8525950.1 hypothetical protein KY384_000712 [Bacidia gigantensis]
MPLEPYQYQPAGSKASTPSPTIRQSGGHGRCPSASSIWSSPESVDTRATTPSISPAKYVGGRDILPRIRDCDQGLETEFSTASYRRAQSQECDPSFSVPSSRPGYQRSTTCPPEYGYVPTPTSITTQDSWCFSALDSPVDFQPSLQRSGTGHVRAISTSAINPSQLRRHAFPYRNAPVYKSQEQPTQYLAPQALQSLDFFSDNPFEAPMSDYAYYDAQYPCDRQLTPEFIVNTGVEPATTLMTYFTERNPHIRLVPQNNCKPACDGETKHYWGWWDVRQLRKWEDFNMETIMGITSFPDLLNIDVNASSLKTPAPESYSDRPHSVQALHDIIKNYHAYKVNDALKTSARDRPAIITSRHDSRNGPYFLGSVSNSADISSRNRAVGLVKAYENWNTGMRSGNPIAQVGFLRTLAQLQLLMREQNCRYGYIATEIELVCVRMGTEPGKPFFGELELSNPIQMSTTTGLTACLALWYLHMLTGDDPLPGQCHWSVHIGAPAEHTRAVCCEQEERDRWIAKLKGPQLSECRSAKRHRGWVWPREEYKPKIEGGKPRGRR